MPKGAGSVFEAAYAYGMNNPAVYADPSGLRAAKSGNPCDGKVKRSGFGYIGWNGACKEVPPGFVPMENGGELYNVPNACASPSVARNSTQAGIQMVSDMIAPVVRANTLGVINFRTPQIGGTCNYIVEGGVVAGNTAVALIGAASIARGASAASKGPSLSGRVVLEDTFGDKAISLARRATPEAGYFDVVGHGTPFDVSGLSPQELATQIRNAPGWGGQNVRLIACQTGCPVSTYSQKLANELGVTVKAANVDVFPQYSGTLKLGPGGSWFTYTPK